MLPASERLRANRQFQQVYKQGQSFAEGLVVLYVLRSPDLTLRQAGFSVSKKVGKAVVRNHVKRRLRESYRLLLPELQGGYWAVFVARRRAADADFSQMDRAVRGVLKRSGLLTGGEPDGASA